MLVLVSREVHTQFYASVALWPLSCAGIRCTNIAPGEVATDILDQRPIPPPPERRKLMLSPADVGDMAVAVAKLPAVAHVTEMIMTGKTTVPQAVL